MAAAVRADIGERNPRVLRAERRLGARSIHHLAVVGLALLALFLHHRPWLSRVVHCAVLVRDKLWRRLRRVDMRPWVGVGLSGRQVALAARIRHLDIL